MPDQISNIDFSFRRGTKNAYERADYIDGSLNFTTDTQEMYVEIDGKKLNLSSVVYKENEAAIVAITDPGDKLYVALDTNKLMVYNNGWKYVSGSVLATPTNDGLLSKEDKTKLDTVGNKAEENQRAFSYVKVNGSASIAADTKTDILNVNIGDGLAYTVNTSTDTLSIDSKTWSGNRAAYDAITTKDSNTLYFING